MSYRTRLRKILHKANPARAGVVGRRLNLGCGNDYRAGWVNIDQDPRSVVDLRADLLTVGSHFEAGSVDQVEMIHSIGYLRLWQCRELFSVVRKLLAVRGVFVIETPDIAKCAEVIRRGPEPLDEYMEAIRAVYAFDIAQIDRRELYASYVFGWSAQHLMMELRSAGFSSVREEDPVTHGPRVWRDLRVVASL